MRILLASDKVSPSGQNVTQEKDRRPAQLLRE
jgi:hypothetical protein